MIKYFSYFFSLIILASVVFACKPVRKSYVPYRKRNKCGCPTYGLHFKQQQSTTYCAKATEKSELF
jgi:hypothetical protein